MGLNCLSIHLENSSGVFFAGQEVIGCAVVDVKPEGLKARSIKVKLEGKGEVHWTERHETGSGDNRHTETRHYRNEECYVEFKIPVFGTGDTSVLPGGTHQFPFNFRLPEQLPSSFEGHHGWVRYHIKVKVDRPWAFDSTEKLFFTVISIVDLNQMPEAQGKKTDCKSKNFCCLCCKHGPLSATLTLNQGGYAPGEKMRITAEVDNKSDVTISYVSAKLMQEVEFHATSKTKCSTKTIMRLRNDTDIDPGDSFVWNGEPMCIPALPPSELRYCRIITIHYWLELKVEPKGPHMSMDIKMPIVIGTIPLRERFQYLTPAAPAPFIGGGAYDAGGFAAPPQQEQQQPYPPPTAPSQDPGLAAGGYAAPPPAAAYGAAAAPSAPPMPFASQYPDLPPPSYTEVMKAAEGDEDFEVNLKRGGGDGDDDKNTNANWDYRPKYITWTSRDEP